MITFICLFLPAVLAVWLYEHLRKTQLSRKQWIYRYCANVVFINLACFAAKRFLLDTGGAPFGGILADATPAAACNYLIMAIPAAAVLAFLQVFFSKHAAITVEEDIHEPKEKA